MAVIGPYRLLRTLGACEAGAVWSAFTEDGTSVTVALIDPGWVGDPVWRRRFEAARDELAALDADFSPQSPWVAFAWDEGIGAGQIFQAAGLTYHPVAASVAVPVSAEPPSVPVVARAAVAPQPVVARAAVKVLPEPPVLEPVTVDIATPRRPMVREPQVRGRGRAIADPQSIVRPPRPGVAVEPPAGRERKALLISVSLFLVLVISASLGLILAKLSTRPAPAPTAAPTATVPPAPHGPGKEPPQAGTWPADWPQFASDAATASVGNGNGSRFGFRVPASWTCVAIAISGVDIQYSCTGVTVDGPEGGDLMVRQCPAPCDADIRTGLRQHEDAWGLQWTSGGESFAWAETASLPGRSSYGLIVVGFWRSVQNGPVDREVVLRLTAPLQRSSAVQSVANATYAGIR